MLKFKDISLIKIKKMEKIKIGILYLGLHNQLVKKFGVNHTLSRKEFFCKLGKHYIIPKNIRPLILDEMVKKELIERIDRDRLKVLPCEIDIEKDSNKLYKMAGIF